MGFINDLIGAKNNNLASVDLASGQGGFGSEVNNASARQQQLFDMLTARANGTGGPSAADKMLDQSTNKAIGQEASAIGGIKGINPALAAKMIAENSAGRIQDATGQGAIQRAQEEMGAQGMLGQVLGTERGQQRQQALGAQQINAQVGAGNAGQNAKTGGGLLGGVGSLLGLSHGGDVPEFIQRLAMGGPVRSNFASGFAAGFDGMGNHQQQQPGSSHGLLGDALMSLFSSSAPDTAAPPPESGAPTSYDYATMYGAPGGAGGGSGEYSSQDYANLYGAPAANQTSNMTSGGRVPGKALVSGDSPKNDTVPIMASPDEVVIPRTSARDPEKAKEFVEELNRQREKKGKSGGYADVLRAQEALHGRLAQIERFCYGGKAA